jgi:hypothetical protein
MFFLIQITLDERVEGGDSSGTARAEDPGLSEAKEAAEAVPAERVRRNGHRPVPFLIYFFVLKRNSLISLTEAGDQAFVIRNCAVAFLLLLHRLIDFFVDRFLVEVGVSF